MNAIEPIGTIHTPFRELANMPIQPKGAAEVIGTVRLEKQYAAGLADLDGFSHLYLLYLFHQSKRVALEVVPFMDTVKRGVFATRSPLRPNHIGLSIVTLVGVKEPELTVKGIDVLDGTPLLDVKPYIERFDRVADSRSGWMQAGEQEIAAKRSDNRFIS